MNRREFLSTAAGTALALPAVAKDTPMIPIVDTHRWFGFDLFCAWQDISLMSLMFFLSGLFVPSSLARKGSATSLSDRLFRIGLPLVLVVPRLLPVTYSPP